MVVVSVSSYLLQFSSYARSKYEVVLNTGDRNCRKLMTNLGHHDNNTRMLDCPFHMLYTKNDSNGKHFVLLLLPIIVEFLLIIIPMKKFQQHLSAINIRGYRGYENTLVTFQNRLKSLQKVFLRQYYLSKYPRYKVLCFCTVKTSLWAFFRYADDFDAITSSKVTVIFVCQFFGFLVNFS